MRPRHPCGQKRRFSRNPLFLPSYPLFDLILHSFLCKVSNGTFLHSTRPPDHYAPVSCLLGMSPSQSSALMPLHSVRPVTNRPEGTFGSLRYAFGGDHPSQTARQAVSANHALDLRQPKGRISTAAPPILAYRLHSLRPILHIG